MILFVILLSICILYGMKFSAFHADYLDMEQCTSIRGIFAVIIFISHANGYITLSDSIADTLFLKILYMIGQSMVSKYFFYSGYGILESYKKKQDYEKKFFINRILKTWIHFALAVILYIVLNLAYGRIYSLYRYLLCMIGWNSIGNSNWFICVILMLYLLTWITFMIISSRNTKAVGYTVLFLSIGLCIVLHLAHKNEYWYNTLICYAAGMIFSEYKTKTDQMMRNPRNYWMCMIAVLFIILLCYLNKGTALVYSIFSVCFVLVIVMITMKIKIGNRYLQWLGRYSFSIFILQRIPMLILYWSGVTNPVIFTVLAFISTLILAYAFDQVLEYSDRKLLNIQR